MTENYTIDLHKSAATWCFGLAGVALCALVVAGCPGNPHALKPQDVDGGKPVELDDAAGDVQQTVAQFYAAYNDHSFADADQFTTDDWTLIDAWGESTQGRDDVIKQQDEAHATFLKKTELTLQELSVRFATSDVAVAMAMSRSTPYKGPDGVLHGYENQLSTFIVVQRDDHWVLMLTQHTIVAGVPALEPNAAGVVPADLSGETESEAKRTEKVGATLDWFTALPKSHDFDAAPDYTTPDWNAITPIGFWGRDRAESLAGLRSAFTSFLDGVTFTTEHRSVRFASDDVAVVTELNKTSPFTYVDGVKHTDDQTQRTTVVVNRDGGWRLMHVHSTAILAM